ncbi:MAG: hypothetical protein ACE5E7_02080 [Anaerolineae bacterium]
MSLENKRLPYVWDYDISPDQFLALLRGELTVGRLNQTWAAVRLLEYASYDEIRCLIGFSLLVEKWPEWREHIRAPQRRDAFDFLVSWLPENHPELLN